MNMLKIYERETTESSIHVFLQVHVGGPLHTPSPLRCSQGFVPAALISMSPLNSRLLFPSNLPIQGQVGAVQILIFRCLTQVTVLLPPIPLLYSYSSWLSEESLLQHTNKLKFLKP